MAWAWKRLALFSEIAELIHGSRHETGGADEISIASLAGESTELASHKVLSNIHHTKYTDGEAQIIADAQIGTHTADLDAHTKNTFEVRRTGEYHMSPYVTNRNMTPRAVVANTLYGMPFLITRSETEDRIACHVTAEAGENIRMGIYNIGANLYPGTLLDDSGFITLAAIGIQAIIINQALPKGLYFVAIISDGTPTINGAEGNCQTPMGFRSTDFGSINGRWAVAQAYGALPDPFTAGAAFDFYPAPAIAFRLLTLD